MSRLFVQALLGVAVILSILGRSNGLSTYIFWLFMLGFVLITYLIVNRSPEKHKILSLVIFSLIVSSIHVAALPYVHQLGTDEVFEAQYSEAIIEEGKWNPGLGAGYAKEYYGYNPVLHLFVALVSVASGVNSYALVVYLFYGLFRLIMVLLVLIVLRIISSQKIAYLATLIFASSAGFMFISVTRRTMASMMVLLALYAILKGRSRLWYVLFMLFSLLIIAANHSIALYFLIFLIGLWVSSLFVSQIPRVLPHLSFYAAIFIISQYITGVFIGKDIRYLNQIIQMFTKFNIVPGSGVLDVYKNYELLLIYFSQVLFVLIGGMGLFLFVYFLWKKKQVKAFSHPWFSLYLAIYGFCAYALSSFLMTTPLDVSVLIVLWFFGIPICLFCAYMLHRAPRLWVSGVLVIIVFGALMMGNYTPRLTNRMPNEDIVVSGDNRALTSEMNLAGEWLYDSFGPSYVIGDNTVFEIFSGLYGHHVYIYDYWLNVLYFGTAEEVESMISGDFEFGKHEHVNDEDKIDFLVINKLLSEYPSVQFGEKFDVKTEHLDTNQMLDQIYSNNRIIMYRIKR